MLKHKTGKCNQIVLSRQVALLYPISNQLEGFDVIREMYEADKDFGEIYKFCKGG